MNTQILEVPIFYTKALTEGIKDDKSVVNLARGDSEFQTPAPIIDYICKILPDPGDNLDSFNAAKGRWTHYEKGKGSINLINAIVQKYKKESNLDITPENVLITQAGMNAIFTSFISLTTPGDEILIPDPCYIAYDPIANYILSGRTGTRITLREENNFVLTVEQLDKVKTNKTKALILTSPLNPTGTLYSKKSLSEIMDWGRQNKIYIIHDENHEKEIYDNNIHYPIRLFDKEGEYSVLLNSFSRLGMGGWRLGWMVASGKVMKVASLAHSYINMTCNTFVQEAGAYTINNYDKLGFDAIFKDYQNKRDFLIAELNQINGIKCMMPMSTCYAFPNIKQFYQNKKDEIHDVIHQVIKQKISTTPQKENVYKRDLSLSKQSLSYAVYLYLLMKAKVGVLPGIAYGPESDNYVRFSFSVKKEALEEGIKRIKSIV